VCCFAPFLTHRVASVLPFFRLFLLLALLLLVIADLPNLEMQTKTGCDRFS
jgi:hypothetical protein